jgi:uncharacterized protein (UPF0305 family)
LKLSEEEFWNLDYSQYVALQERWQIEQEQREYLSALICSVLANINNTKKSKSYKPSDFMRKPKKKQTQDEMLYMMKLIAGAFENVE